ncbi:hypothetical protein [Bordetella avium]|uniref:Exported protein n=1 Tax=Bordetella avium (strain 197N) TaxID=360910 RepID=Q2L1M9_BORA1|nr:hypothetical protein [Bordetella avium]AZY48995.1 hypothetical protein C0J09_07470 [Bordetella avium]AZY52356.1 hypothetical protein C0J07_07445 [Bordetella avium]RIQ14239.1 hypothetical protein D0432_08320 [Bordetella avium]RIQ18114.1 hypothetical protein D0850_08255 [Bordetella avium]RIQ36586.1 hypothetical protein D0849_02730 [Bordetella avium]
MKFRFLQLSGALVLATMTATSPALAGGPRWAYHGGHPSYYNGHRSGHHHSSAWSASDRWIVGGALALVTAGLLLSANSSPSPEYGPIYEPAYAYPALPAPAGPPSANTLSSDPTDPASVNLAPVGLASRAPGADCQRQAMNESGFDPATPNPWTTQIMVDSYNRALQTCLSGRG